MPTKFIINKWLCDECPQMYEVETQCYLHEREMHKRKSNVDDGDVDALEGMLCARIQKQAEKED